jgi:hypothetical protein
MSLEALFLPLMVTGQKSVELKRYVATKARQRSREFLSMFSLRRARQRNSFMSCLLVGGVGFEDG